MKAIIFALLLVSISVFLIGYFYANILIGVLGIILFLLTVFLEYIDSKKGIL
jgi:hypothetical protein